MRYSERSRRKRLADLVNPFNDGGQVFIKRGGGWGVGFLVLWVDQMHILLACRRMSWHLSQLKTNLIEERDTESPSRFSPRSLG